MRNTFRSTLHRWASRSTLAALFLVGGHCAVAQTTVDLKLERMDGSNLRVSMRNNGPTFNGVMSSLVFTLRWPDGNGGVPSLGTLSCPGAVGVFSSGGTVTVGGYNYRSYFVLGMTTIEDACPGFTLPSGEWQQVVTFAVENQGGGCAGYEVVNDAFTASDNRDYYVAFGGADVTGALMPNTALLGSGCPCDHDLELLLEPDGFSSQTSWEIIDQTSGFAVCAGGGYPDGLSFITETCCVPDGCYRLRVLDASGDGMVSGGFTGGYILQAGASDDRLIDNRRNFDASVNGAVSAISAAEGFCLPMSTRNLLWTSRDKLDWITAQFVVAEPDPAVSAVWIPGGSNAQQSSTTGYEFWFFDPNGGYSYKRFRSHATSDGFGSGATRACHMRINNWPAASHIPSYDLMNVRVRSRVNGVNGEWGPASRFKIDPERAQCPYTNLIDQPGHADFSCGVSRTLGSGAGSRVLAQPVSGANRYQFRFRIPSEGFQTIRTFNSYICQLNWGGAGALQVGKTYDVDVRISKDGGTTWCTSDDPWGDVCTVSIVAPSGMASAGGGLETLTNPVAMRVAPNPTEDDRVNVYMENVVSTSGVATITLIDAVGKRVRSEQYSVQESALQAWKVDVADLSTGVYLVEVSVDEQVYTERVMVAR